jgi:hypothetical protein
MDEDPYGGEGDDTTMMMPEEHISPGTPDIEFPPETITPEGQQNPDPNYQDKQSEVDQALSPLLDEMQHDTAQQPSSPWENVDLEPNSIFGPGNAE